MNSKTRYYPTETGYAISGSQEVFNRMLYGSHMHDDNPPKFVTFAGDAPQFMGVSADWTKSNLAVQEKRGVLISGLALTPGEKTNFWYSNKMDTSSRWFHNSEDVRAEFKQGWMEYELSQISPWFPDVRVKIEVYPLHPDDGFLVHYKISTDQRAYFVAGFGGLTDMISRFEYNDEPRRYFSVDDCADNKVEIGKNRACITHPGGAKMHIATSFDAEFELGSAKTLTTRYAGLFLGSSPEDENDNVVKISAVIDAGKELDGYIIAIQNADDKLLDSWLSKKDPVKYIKQQIYAKHACISLNTPENPLDLTVAPTVIAMDAAWHHNSFNHGALAYHAPFLGWRNWYAPTVLAWRERVETTIAAHFSQIVKKSDKPEYIWFPHSKHPKGTEAAPDPALFPSQYQAMENSYGYLPYFLWADDEYYNMQECALDMMLYYIEWTGNLSLAEKYFDDMCAILDYEERIFDPDGDGLYQNFLNTWISDGHAYNGGGCAQASSYNYRANLTMSKIARKLGRPSEVFENRAEKIKKAVADKLWLANEGVIAESIDTIGNCMIHPSPELSTAYLAIDSGIVDDFKAYTMLKYTENRIKSIVTANGGRLAYCSNWLPKKYSTYGIFPAENAHLALTYFKIGLKEKGKELIDGIVDCYFTGKNPGLAGHVQSALGTNDLGDIDFSDVAGTYLRVMVEGLFGIKLNAVDEEIIIAPSFPDDWNNANLTLSDISLHYNKKGNQDIFDITCERDEKKVIRVPMRGTGVEAVMLDGAVADYKIVPAPNNSFIMVEVKKSGRFQLRVMHEEGILPTVKCPCDVLEGNEIAFEVANGTITEVLDINEALDNITVVGNKIYAVAKSNTGFHTLFVRTKSGEYDAYLAADYKTTEKAVEPPKPNPTPHYEIIDISNHFNCDMKEIHNMEYVSPRPECRSIGVLRNGRYAWEWNHGGHNAVVIDDTSLRNSGGVVHSASGIPFATPSVGENVACVSIWDNFPTKMTVPLDGTGHEIAVMFISTTNSMQTDVENVRITVEYADGEKTASKLVYPENFDDWLLPVCQTGNETMYFSHYNHATIHKIKLDSGKKLVKLEIEAIANDVIMGVMGVSIDR